MTRQKKPVGADGEGAVVAIIRFGAAGDVIRVTPAIEALAKAWPKARRVVVTHAHLESLVARCRVPIEHVAFKRAKGLAPLARSLKETGVTHVLDLHGTTRSFCLGLLLWPRPRVRIFKRGFVEWARVCLAFAPHRVYETCAVRQRRAIAQLTGVDAPLPSLSLRAPLVQRSARPHIGLSPGANWTTKRWPVDRWAALACDLHARGYVVSVFGSHAESDLVSSVCAKATGAIARIGLHWDAFAEAISNQHVFVCGDSGPLHLAMGLGVPSVGLFQSTPDDAFDAPASTVIRGQAACRPCSFYGRRACPREHGECWKSIAVAQVASAIERLVADRTSS